MCIFDKFMPIFEKIKKNSCRSRILEKKGVRGPTVCVDISNFEGFRRGELKRDKSAKKLRNAQPFVKIANFK